MTAGVCSAGLTKYLMGVIEAQRISVYNDIPVQKEVEAAAKAAAET